MILYIKESSFVKTVNVFGLIPTKDNNRLREIQKEFKNNIDDLEKKEIESLIIETQEIILRSYGKSESVPPAIIDESKKIRKTYDKLI